MLEQGQATTQTVPTEATFEPVDHDDTEDSDSTDSEDSQGQPWEVDEWQEYAAQVDLSKWGRVIAPRSQKQALELCLWTSAPRTSQGLLAHLKNIEQGSKNYACVTVDHLLKHFRTRMAIRPKYRITKHLIDLDNKATTWYSEKHLHHTSLPMAPFVYPCAATILAVPSGSFVRLPIICYGYMRQATSSPEQTCQTKTELELGTSPSTTHRLR